MSAPAFPPDVLSVLLHIYSGHGRELFDDYLSGFADQMHLEYENRKDAMRESRNTIALIACGVLQWNFERIIGKCADGSVAARFLPAQLHNNPVKLRELLQNAIDELSEEPVIAIAVGYGVCGRGTVGLQARGKPLIIPRVQDCIGAMLGSHGRYMQEFSQKPGTRYVGQGWFEKTMKERAEESHHTDRNRSLYGPTFDQLTERYGENNASYICQFRESWKRNYQRAAYIRFPGEKERPEGVRITEGLAEDLGWEHELIDGDESLLEAMLTGNWRDPRILVVPPRCTTIAAPGDAVLDYVAAGGNDLEALAERYQDSQHARSTPVRTGIGLGIDTGGTYTDAAIYDFDKAVVLSYAKAPTTHTDLAAGIRNVLSRLSKTDVGNVTRVGLSTTLATNAFVEGKGRAVGLLLMCPYPIAGGRDGPLPFRYVHHIAGCMTMQGLESAPLDPDEVRRCAREAREAGCEALAVSGFASVINPVHEIEAARLAFEETGLHAVCGHELTTRLNFVERATTAAMNARIVPLIESLIDAVQKALSEHGLGSAKLMVVKGDGSQILADVARQFPVETLLSGPAASVVGATVLFGAQDGIVADLGGTTLDVAMVKNGAAVISETGARIGGFQTSVRAMAVETVGLGGDSEIDLSHWPDVSIGPRRVVPLCRITESYPDVTDVLEEQFRDAVAPVANCLDVVALAAAVGDTSSRIANHLEAGPLPLALLARRMNRAFPEHIGWEDLETRGDIVRYGLTLTDLLHVQDRFLTFDRRPAELCLKYWSALHEVTVEALIEGIYHQFRSQFCDTLLTVALPDDCPWQKDSALRPWLNHHFAQNGPTMGGGILHATLPCPVIGVGAPASALMPQLEGVVSQDILLSPVSSVANAVGAIAGDVLVRETATIRLPDDGSLVCSWRGGSGRALNMREALDLCENALNELIRSEAKANDVPFTPPVFSTSIQKGKTREGPVILGVSLTAELKG